MTSHLNPLTNPVHANDIGVGADILRGTGGWSWRAPRYADRFRTCDYCGCIHPEDLLAAHDWHAEWADMKYGWPHKFYVTLPIGQDNALLWVCRSSTHGPAGFRLQDPPGYYIPATELTEEQVQTLIDDRSYSSREEWESEKLAMTEGNKYHGYHFTLAGEHTLHHKFYTEHLKDPDLSAEVKDELQRRSGLRFEWLDDGRVRWYQYRQDEG